MWLTRGIERERGEHSRKQLERDAQVSFVKESERGQMQAETDPQSRSSGSLGKVGAAVIPDM